VAAKPTLTGGRLPPARSANLLARVHAVALEGSLSFERVLGRAHSTSARSAQKRLAPRPALLAALHRELAQEELKVAPSLLGPGGSLPQSLPLAGPRASPDGHAGRTGAERAEAIAALVTRVGVAARLRGATLDLSLGSGAAAQVRIARTGPGEVAIRLSARGGRRGAVLAAAGQLRSSLAARGLAVRSITVA